MLDISATRGIDRVLDARERDACAGAGSGALSPIADGFVALVNAGSERLVAARGDVTAAPRAAR